VRLRPRPPVMTMDAENVAALTVDHGEHMASRSPGSWRPTRPEAYTKNRPIRTRTRTSAPDDVGILEAPTPPGARDCRANHRELATRQDPCRGQQALITPRATMSTARVGDDRNHHGDLLHASFCRTVGQNAGLETAGCARSRAQSGGDAALFDDHGPSVSVSRSAAPLRSRGDACR